MQKEVDNILVEIPEALPARVGEALSQVRANPPGGGVAGGLVLRGWP